MIVKEISENTRYTFILNDIHNNIMNNAEIANKYKVSPWYIIQIRKRFDQLKYKPLIKNGKLKCQLCDKQNNIVIHHIHKTGKYIAILCRGCNVMVRENELEYVEKYTKVSKLMVNIRNLLIDKELTIKEISKELNIPKSHIRFYLTKLLKRKKVFIFGIKTIYLRVNIKYQYFKSYDRTITIKPKHFTTKIISKTYKTYSKKNILYWFKDN